MTLGIGHNSGQDAAGYTGRLHQWRAARRALLGNALPVEVVRLRVRRAAALGLDYGTYASVRAGTGRDIAALLFSSNALGNDPAGGDRRAPGGEARGGGGRRAAR